MHAARRRLSRARREERVAPELLCGLAVGVPFWRVPYDDIALPQTLVSLALAGIFFASLLSTSLGWARVRRTIFVLGGAVPVAVMARAGWEALQDPGTHALWPFELIIATFVGASVAAPGAVLGAFPDLIRILRRRVD